MFSVGITGSITSGEAVHPSGDRVASAATNRTGGLSVDRFAELQQAGPSFINAVPAISVFFKPGLSGTRHLKESTDRALITWSLTEPFGGIQDMTWTPTVNRFQAVLHKDGSIEFSYDEVHAEDTIVGLYPMVTTGSEKEIAVIDAKTNPEAASPLDITKVRLAAVDRVFLKVTLETRGRVLQEKDPALTGVSYRICLDRATPPADQYKKGALFLNTLRSVIDNDDVWFKLLHDYYQHFKFQTIMTTDMVAFFNGQSGLNLTPIFNQYLRHAAIPTLELKFNEAAHTISYRWEADEPGFEMPIRVGRSNEWQVLHPSTTEWRVLSTTLSKDEVEVATDLFYVNVRKL